MGKNGMLGRGLESLIPPNQSSYDEHGSEQAPQDGNNSELRTPNFELEEKQNIREQNLADLKRDPLPPPAIPQNRERMARQAPSVSFKKVNTSETSPVFHIEIAKIKPNPEQPRSHFGEESLLELANSIREFGILQPLLVSKIERDTEGGADVEYQLIAGERRLRAAELAGMAQVPVIIRKPISKREQLELAIIENLQREDLNAIEAARAFARLQDEFHLTQREIASRLGKSRESIANTLRLLSLPSSVQLAIQSGTLNESQGRMLLMVSNPGEQERLFDDILESNLSVRELRHRIKLVTKEVSPEKQKGDEAELLEEYDDPEVSDLKDQLETFFGAPVTIKKQGESGRIVIEFYSPEELRGIALKLAKSTESHELDSGYSDEFVI